MITQIQKDYLIGLIEHDLSQFDKLDLLGITKDEVIGLLGIVKIIHTIKLEKCEECGEYGEYLEEVDKKMVCIKCSDEVSK